jgi:hypothetical protein
LSAPTQPTFTSLTEDDYERAAATRALRIVGAVQSPAELNADMREGDMLMGATGRSVLSSPSAK